MKHVRSQMLFAVLLLIVCCIALAGCSGTCPALQLRSPVVVQSEVPNSVAVAAPVATYSYTAPAAAVCEPAEPLFSVRKSYQREK